MKRIVTLMPGNGGGPKDIPQAAEVLDRAGQVIEPEVFRRGLDIVFAQEMEGGMMAHQGKADAMGSLIDSHVS